MNKPKWHFDDIGPNSRNSLNDRKNPSGNTYSSLTREVIQNSLDARSKKSKSKQVTIKFEICSLNLSEPLFNGLKEKIKDCEKYIENSSWGEKEEKFYEKASKVMNSAKSDCLKISDFGTRGITTEDWERLQKETSKSTKSNSVSGGSYGVGHKVPLRISDLGSIIYETILEDGNKLLSGKTFQISSYDSKNQNKSGNGFFGTENEDGLIERIDTDNLETKNSKMQLRDEVGTTLWVLGFDNPENWEERVKRNVLINYFKAIWDGELIVEISTSKIELVINKQTIKKYFDECIELSKLNKKETSEDKKEIKELEESYCFYKCIEKPTEVLERNIKNLGECKFFFKMEEDFPNLIADTRNGMLIKSKGRTMNMLGGNYAMVFECINRSGKELLRSSEPSDHKDWDDKYIDDENKKIKFNKAIDDKRKISRELIKKYEISYENSDSFLLNLDIFPGSNSNGTISPKPLPKYSKYRPQYDYRRIASDKDLTVKFRLDIEPPQTKAKRKSFIPILKQSFDAKPSKEIARWDREVKEGKVEKGKNKNAKYEINFVIKAEDKEKLDHALEIHLEENTDK